AHLAEVYGASVSKETISAITDSMLEAMREWQHRPLDPVYPVVFIDAIRVKIREGTVTNRPIYLAVGVTVEGKRDLLGLWAGEPGDGEGAKYWLRVLTELRNRGVKDVLMAVCDGLKGLPESIEATWPAATVQTCVIHLIRNSFRYASRRDWDALKRALKPIYQAASETDAREAFEDLTAEWGERYPTIVRLWDAQWATFTPFLAYDIEIRKLICSTNAIESINARIRRAVNARGHFPTEQAALKCVYMALMALDPKGTGQKRWSSRWKLALQAFEMTFPGRLGIDTVQ
ncbi:IS256 family transposase, partial [Glycomyces salinus]|uniref:IS256 family transposase n=1 Tax=Glycomyces salinus TaxID=980294 RepID=UPI0018EC09AE